MSDSTPMAPDTDPLEHARSRLTRPRKWVVGVATMLLLVGLANLARGGLAIAYAMRLPEVPMSGYVAISSLAWGLAFTVEAVALAGFWHWARLAVLISAMAYQIHVWVNHLLLDASECAQRTWPRDVLFSALFLAIVYAVLCSPSIGQQFQREEH